MLMENIFSGKYPFSNKDQSILIPMLIIQRSSVQYADTHPCSTFPAAFPSVRHLNFLGYSIHRNYIFCISPIIILFTSPEKFRLYTALRNGSNQRQLVFSCYNFDRGISFVSNHHPHARLPATFATIRHSSIFGISKAKDNIACHPSVIIFLRKPKEFTLLCLKAFGDWNLSWQAICSSENLDLFGELWMYSYNHICSSFPSTLSTIRKSCFIGVAEFCNNITGIASIVVFMACPDKTTVIVFNCLKSGRLRKGSSSNYNPIFNQLTGKNRLLIELSIQKVQQLIRTWALLRVFVQHFLYHYSDRFFLNFIQKLQRRKILSLSRGFHSINKVIHSITNQQLEKSNTKRPNICRVMIIKSLEHFRGQVQVSTCHR